MLWWWYSTWCLLPSSFNYNTINLLVFHFGFPLAGNMGNLDFSFETNSQPTPTPFHLLSFLPRLKTWGKSSINWQKTQLLRNVSLLAIVKIDKRIPRLQDMCPLYKSPIISCIALNTWQCILHMISFILFGFSLTHARLAPSWDGASGMDSEEKVKAHPSSPLSWGTSSDKTIFPFKTLC